MKLIKKDTGNYRTTSWSWWSDEGHQAIRFSPNFHSLEEAEEWHDQVVVSILKEIEYRGISINKKDDEK